MGRSVLAPGPVIPAVEPAGARYPPPGGAGHRHHGPDVVVAGAEPGLLLVVGAEERRTLEVGHHEPHAVDQPQPGLAPVLPAVLHRGVDDAEPVVRVPLAGADHPPPGVVTVGVAPAPGRAPCPPVLQARSIPTLLQASPPWIQSR